MSFKIKNIHAFVAVGEDGDEGKYCVDIMSQLRAARNAVKTIELGVLETHMNACVTDACCSKDKTLKKERIQEIMQLLKKYE